MKKIISIFLLTMFLVANFSFAQVLNSNCGTAPSLLASQQAIDAYNDCIANPTTQGATTNPTSCTQDSNCIAGYKCSIQIPYTQGTCVKSNGGCTSDSDCILGYICDKNSPSTTYLTCIKNPTSTTPTSTACYTENGITVCPDCLLNGQCKLNIYDTLGIRQNARGTGDMTSVGLFVQDIILSATFFIGTLVTIALVVSGLMYIFAGASGNSTGADKAKKGIINSLIGLAIVACSYFIIRLVQYIAKGF